ncbi:MAG: pyruvate dehydrogenase (acetyl-transferring) E1 component subunit alpha [Armatimonadetes bacterium]|nr:pyruvate dehydrogenase (acetyl-transferring) E1 component subunit alpha [Armatimonadota bacterium]
MDKDEAIKLYRLMRLIRRFEERARQMYTQGKFSGYFHTYNGQEAVAVGFCSVLRKGDTAVQSYRDHGTALALGCTAREVMAELYGKRTGMCKGKGGSMHLFSKEHGLLGGSGIVGGSIPIGTGAAFASKYRGDGSVNLNFFGDGAMNIGTYHESVNLAALWKLPCIYIVENNLYAMGTSLERQMANTDLAERAKGDGIATEKVDGQDVLAVREVAERVIGKARETGEPHFVEALTYRFVPHGTADPGTYRTKEEVAEWQQRDPILVFEKHLLERGWADEELFRVTTDEVRREVEDSIDFSEESPWPDPHEVWEDVTGPLPSPQNLSSEPTPAGGGR